MKYDLIVIGSGPGGYVAAIRASQLGLKTALVEKEKPGGVCLNWGCIPTKALLKSAEVFDKLSHSEDYGIYAGKPDGDFDKIIDRSRAVAGQMSKGIEFLMRKNKVDVISGTARLKPQNGGVDVDGKTYESKNIIIATGARSRELPEVRQNGKTIIGYREALTLKKQPGRILVIGSGAIGTELAYFYSTMGTEVTIVEYQPNIIPLEDVEVSRELEKSFKKKGISILTSTAVQGVKERGGALIVELKNEKGTQSIESDVVLCAAGIKTNIENIGLEDIGIKVEKDKIITDSFYKTNIDGYYAIGDVTTGPALAHVASAEAVCCVEKIAGLAPSPIDYENIPGCIYASPQVASVGFTEERAKQAGYELKVGRFPFKASGKAKAAGAAEGFVKLIYDAKYGELLGAHLIGENVTELIAEAVLARKLESTGMEILKTIHPHPTMSEAIMEATAAAYGDAIHL